MYDQCNQTRRFRAAASKTILFSGGFALQNDGVVVNKKLLPKNFIGPEAVLFLNPCVELFINRENFFSRWLVGNVVRLFRD